MVLNLDAKFSAISAIICILRKILANHATVDGLDIPNRNSAATVTKIRLAKPNKTWRMKR